MKKLVKQYEALPSLTRILIASLVPAGTFMVGAIFELWVDHAAHESGWKTFLLYLVCFLILFTLIAALAENFRLARELMRREREKKTLTFLDAHKRHHAVNTGRLKDLEAASVHSDTFIHNFIASEKVIQSTVDAAYQTFESAYGGSVRSEDRIDFEVTFMTKSYQDGYITIPACANKDGRNPRSMVLRKTHLDIYDRTVTADVYRADRPSMRIIEDTKQTNTYSELYPSETDRIRSSIIYPVLSSENVLLGTLVVHCDRPHFFKQQNQKYWGDILEVFAKRIALEKKKLDILIGISAANPISIRFPIAKPF
jgi:GAF domain-containing protein